MERRATGREKKEKREKGREIGREEGEKDREGDKETGREGERGEIFLPAKTERPGEGACSPGMSICHLEPGSSPSLLMLLAGR